MKLICINYNHCGYWEDKEVIDTEDLLICPECYNPLIIHDNNGEKIELEKISLSEDIFDRTRNK